MTWRFWLIAVLASLSMIIIAWVIGGVWGAVTVFIIIALFIGVAFFAKLLMKWAKMEDNKWRDK